MSTVFQGYDLPARYAEFNSLYFGDRLPTIPLAFKPLQNAAGIVNFTFFRTAPGKPNGYVDQSSITLYLSNVYERSHEHLDGILLHEMIHVHFCVLNDWQETHGINFEFMRRDLQTKSGIRIPRRDIIDDLTVPDEVVRTLGVVLISSKKDKPTYVLTQEEDIRSEKLLRYCDRLVERGANVTRYVVSTPVWTKLSMQVRVYKSFISPDQFFVRPEALDDLVKNGQVVE
jgi:hypothetical protein